MPNSFYRTLFRLGPKPPAGLIISIDKNNIMIRVRSFREIGHIYQIGKLSKQASKALASKLDNLSTADETYSVAIDFPSTQLKLIMPDGEKLWAKTGFATEYRSNDIIQETMDFLMHLEIERPTEVLWKWQCSDTDS